MLLNGQHKFVTEKNLFNLLCYFKKKYYERNEHIFYNEYMISYYYSESRVVVKKDNIIMIFDTLNEKLIFKDLNKVYIAKISIIEDSCFLVYLREGYSLPTEFIEGLYSIIDR